MVLVLIQTSIIRAGTATSHLFLSQSYFHCPLLDRGYSAAFLSFLPSAEFSLSQVYLWFYVKLASPQTASGFSHKPAKSGSFKMAAAKVYSRQVLFLSSSSFLRMKSVS